MGKTALGMGGIAGIAYAGRPALPAIPYYHSRATCNRHSRVSGNLDGTAL